MGVHMSTKNGDTFIGDFTRNEVQLDLDKFMKMQQEIADLKDKIRDYEIKERDSNPYEKWIHLAQSVDSWRIFPRLFLTVYIVLLYKTVIWFMELQAPTMEQSGLISIVVGAGAAWFGLYTGSSKSKNKDK